MSRRSADIEEESLYRALCARDARFDGRLFVGVRTTGVYCRPVCPARTPRRENIRFYPTAAAAQEAGFRPCLRCRPESAPDFGAWRGASNTVARGLALIETGALDEGDVDHLAERVGVGERQLRRLFRQHLGASPIAVAQTRRVLLAKQLLHETQLSMTEVALASGFSSLRRFNETFRGLYGRPPSALRRDRRRGEARRPDTILTLRLPFRPPLDWQALEAHLAARAVAGVERVSPGRYDRVVAIGEDIGVVSVAPGVGAWLDVAFDFPRLSQLPELIARVRRLFDLGADPASIAACLSADPDLAPRVAARPGLRAPGAWDGFELAVRAVLGQQVSVSAAAGLASLLARRHGAPRAAGPIQDAESLFVAFPTADRLAGADLSDLPMPRSRSRAVAALAEAAAADPALLAPGGDTARTLERLRALPGIGPWTASYIALRALRDPDAFPAGDLGLQRALTDQDGRRPTASQLEARSQAWRPWRAYAAQYLWTPPLAPGAGT